MGERDESDRKTDARGQPTSIRLTGALGSEVDDRIGGPGNLGAAAIIRRDLERYYGGCYEVLRRRTNFDYVDASMLVDLLGGITFQSNTAHYLWAELEEQVRRRGWEPESPDYARAATLAAQLRSFSTLDCLAVIDAIEKYEVNYHDNGQYKDRALEVSGLTTSLPDPDHVPQAGEP